jgi:hypothetical protein
MGYSPDAEPMGPYWAKEWGPREHCYSIIPLENGVHKNLMSEVWNDIFFTLGKLGYLFRDAGHDIQHAVVSLNKTISPEHLKHLEGRLKIIPDSGSELGFC